MDIYASDDMYESFRRYQASLLAQFDRLAEEYEFKVVDASTDIRTMFEHLRAAVLRILHDATLHLTQASGRHS
jgi:thymidylate kinase